MKNKMIRNCILCLLCFSGATVFAQDNTNFPDSIVWDLKKCLEYAYQNNITLNSLRLSKQSTEQEFLLSKAAVLPDLYGSASQTFNHYNSTNNVDNTTTGNRNSDFRVSGSLGLNSSWTLYQGGYLRSDIKQKDLSVQSANFSILENEEDISLQITQSYLNILLDKESIVYAQDLVKTSIAQLEQARQRFSAGAIARKDVAQLQAQLANDQYTLTSALNAERQDKLSLKQILQLPTEVNFDVVKPDSITALNPVSSLKEVQHYALQNRPEVKNSLLGIEIAKLSLDKALAGYKPSLSLGGNIGTDYITGNNYSTFNQFDRNLNQQLGINLSIPIFTNRLNKTNAALARIAIDQAQLNFKETTTVLSQTVEQAYINVQNAQSQYSSAEEQLKFASEVYRIANEELRLGAADITDFYLQRNQYIQALQANIQAKYNAALAVKIYQFYIGEPLTID